MAGTPLPPTVSSSSCLTLRHMRTPGSQVTSTTLQAQADTQERSHTDLHTLTHSSCAHHRQGPLWSRGFTLVAGLSDLHTHRREPAPRKIKMEFNEKTEQTVLLKCRAWTARVATDKPPVYRQLPPFSPLSLCFPKIFPPQTTSIPPFPCLWFLPYTSGKFCAIPKCSSPATHNVSCTPGQ